MTSLLALLLLTQVPEDRGGMITEHNIGPYDLDGSDLKNPDDMYSEAVSTDAAPRVTVITPQACFPGLAATNDDGANLVLSGTPAGINLTAVTKAGTGTDTITFAGILNTGAAFSVTLTEGTDYTCAAAATDIVCVCNLYTAVTGHATLGTVVNTLRTDATCSDEGLFFGIVPGTSAWLTVTPSDGTNTVVSTGTDGHVVIPTVGLGAPGRVLCTSSVDNFLECTNAAGQGWRLDFTTNNAVTITDEVGGGVFDIYTQKFRSSDNSSTYFDDSTNRSRLVGALGAILYHSSDILLDAGAMLHVFSGTGDELSADGNSEIQYGVLIEPKVNQNSGVSAAVRMLAIKGTIASEGTGQNYIAHLDYNGDGTPEFAIENDGDVFITGKLHTPHQFEDNFLYTGPLYGNALGAWDLTNTTGAGTNVIAAGSGRGGIATLTTGVNADDFESTWIRDDWFSRAINPMLEVHAILDTDLVDKEVRIGFGDTDTRLEAGGDYVYFQFDESVHGTHWYYGCSDAADATLGVGPTADTAQALMIHLYSTGVAEFYINHVLIDTVAGCVDADTAMYVAFQIEAEDGGGGGAEILEVDHIDARWD